MVGRHSFQARSGSIGEDFAFYRAQFRMQQYLSRVREAHAPGIESGIPERRE